MPRPAWLALGAAAGALGLEVVSPVVLLLAGLGIASVAVALWSAGRGRCARQSAALALGIVALGLRGAGAASGAAPAAVIPSGEGPWIGVVQSVGSPRAGARAGAGALQGG